MIFRVRTTDSHLNGVWIEPIVWSRDHGKQGLSIKSGFFKLFVTIKCFRQAADTHLFASVVVR